MPYLINNSRLVYQFETGAIVPAQGWLPIGDGLTVDWVSPTSPIPFPAQLGQPGAAVLDLQGRSVTSGIGSSINLQLPPSLNALLPSVWALPAPQSASLESASNAFQGLTKGSGTIDGSTLRTVFVQSEDLAIENIRSGSSGMNSIVVNQSATQILNANPARTSAVIGNCSSDLIYLGFSSLVAPGFYWRKLFPEECLPIPDRLLPLAVWAYGNQPGQNMTIVSG